MASAQPGYSQTAEQDVEARLEQFEPEPRRAEGPSIQFTSQRPPANADQIVFTLSGVEIVGATLYSEDEFSGVIGERMGAEISLAQVYDIAGEIQALYRNDDYIFTRVIVPAQEIEGGRVKIEVVEAVIESITIEEPAGSIGPVINLAEEMLSGLIGRPNPTGMALERALLVINDIPGIVRATAVPQPGPSGDRGALALFVNVERRALEAIIYGDNRQTSSIGRGIFGGTVKLNGYSSWGDTTAVSYFNSFGYASDGFGKDDGIGDFDERNTLQVEHSRYLTADGLRLLAQGLYSRSRPGDELADVGIEGEQILVDIGLEYPLYQTRLTTLHGTIGGYYLNSQIDVSNGALQVTRDRIRHLYAKLEGVDRDSLGYSKATVELRQGLKILNASEIGKEPLLSRNDGRADFTVVQVSAERLLQFTDEFSFLAKASGQYAFTPLLASQEFEIGGLSFGRGFDPSELTGDHGVGVSGEARYRTRFGGAGLPVTAEGYAFVDYGHIWNVGEGVPDKGDLFTAGAGVRLFLPEKFVLGLEVAFPLDQPLARTKSDDPRFFVNASKQF